MQQNPRDARVLSGGSDRRRSGDLSIFSRTLYQLSYRARTETYWPGLATPTGLEPATSAVTGRRANQLRYGALLESTGVDPTSSNLALQTDMICKYPQRDLNPCYRRERAAS